MGPWLTSRDVLQNPILRRPDGRKKFLAHAGFGSRAPNVFGTARGVLLFDAYIATQVEGLAVEHDAVLHIN